MIHAHSKLTSDWRTTMERSKRVILAMSNIVLVIALRVEAQPVAPPSANQPPAAANRKVFSDSVVPLPASEGPTLHGLNVHAISADNKKDKLKVLVSLTIPNETQKKLQEKINCGQVV